MLIGRPLGHPLPRHRPQCAATVTRTRLAGTYLRIAVDVRPML